MSGRWSTEIENRYSLRLSDDVRAWLDEQVWHESGGAEFCRAQTPEQLLDPPPGTIWAGFMLPDTLPIIGNDYGDWLCLRIAADGTVSELVQWSHGGGDWIPYGNTLAEGLLYDAAVRVMYPHRATFAEAEPADSRSLRGRMGSAMDGAARAVRAPLLASVTVSDAAPARRGRSWMCWPARELRSSRSAAIASSGIWTARSSRGASPPWPRNWVCRGSRSSSAGYSTPHRIPAAARSTW